MILNITGGGAALNFKVVGGTTQPSDPAVNTIWVNTSTTITGWVFSAEQPVGNQGVVWLRIAVVGNCLFNALKKNSITICPVECQQHDNGVWTAKDFQLFTDQWLTASEYLYRYNQQDHNWQTRAWASNSSFTARTPTVNYESSGIATISLTCSEQKMISGAFEMIQDFDLTSFKTLQLTFKVTGNNAADGYFFVTKRSNTYCTDGAAASIYFIACEKKTITLDVSALTGGYDIGICLRWNPYVDNNDGKNYGTISVSMEELTALP